MATINGASYTIPSHSDLAVLMPLYSLDVNAIAFCKAAVSCLSDDLALVAVPSVMHDDKVDIFALPSQKRVTRSIGKDAWPINDKTGSVMALDLHRTANGGDRLLVAYEDGRLAVFDSKLPSENANQTAEGGGFHLTWHAQGHKQPIMSLALSPDLQTAWTVAADHLVIRWLLPTQDVGQTEVLETSTPGRSSIVIRSDNKLLAIGGWDGRVRVYSAKTFKPLAVLTYHRDTVECIAIAPAHEGRKAWIAAGGKDNRISIWDVY